jgi:outer membrane protein OmpA-like peptidoglycan-associated protein
MMQFKRNSYAILAAFITMPLLAAPTTSAPTVQAAPTVPVMAPAAVQANIPAEQWLVRMGDFTQNGVAFKDPRQFGQWVGVMSDPSMVTTAMPMMMDPATWMRMSSSMMQPAAMNNWMGFADPNVAMRWSGAMMDPNFYMQNAFTMADPNKMMRWMMLPMDPKMMQAGMGMMNPNMYMKWMPMGAMPTGGMQMPAMPMMPFFSNAASAPAAGLALRPGVATRLSLAGDTLFNSGKASIKDLTVAGKTKLDQLASQIKAAGKINVIRVVGHADKTGKTAANMTLSQRRASTVTSYLKAQGVKSGKFISAGMGDTQPVVQCDAKLARAELIACHQPNRRVEVEVTVAK